MLFSAYAQQTDYVDFTYCKALIEFDTIQKSVKGTVRYKFEILKDVDSVFIDARQMQITTPVELVNFTNSNTESITFRYDDSKVWLKYKFKEGNQYQVIINYKVIPKKALYFVGWGNAGPNQIWTQGQGKYTSSWLPSFDDMNEKVTFSLTIRFNENYEVISNGRQLYKNKLENGVVEHVFMMVKPMSSYLLALAIGNYEKQDLESASGVPIELYYYPEDSLKVEPTYRYTKDMFDFLEREISFEYPWQNYKQIPVHDFLYAGMENTSATIFSDGFVIDSIGFNDKNYVNINAHELAHQWFGDLVTEISGTHHWLQEGFATYYALLAEREIFGENYYYWRLYEYAQELLDQDNSGNGTALLNPNSSSITFYKKGAWLLHMLREKIGDVAFRQAVKKYLYNHQFENVESDDFIKEVENVTPLDVDGFFEEWLESPVFPYNEVMASLEQSLFIQEYLMVDCEVNNAKCDYYLEAPLSSQAKAKIVSQVPERIKLDVFNDDLKVRQAIAKSLKTIPSNLKGIYESLLEDESYITIEAALYNLWSNFPDEREKYLNDTKNIAGLNDKNVKLLWLALALSTPDYNQEYKHGYFDELVNYTEPNYNFDVRMGAFSYLEALNLFPEKALINLVDASYHYNWQFSSYARSLMEALSNDEKYADLFEKLKNQ
jgi:aminopeptidase N